MNDYYNSFSHAGGEILLRKLFLNFVSQHPQFVFRLFFIVKPLRILQNALHFHQSVIAINSSWATALIPSDPEYAVYYARVREATKPTKPWAAVGFVALLLVIGLIASSDKDAVKILWRLTGIGLLFSVLAWLPNWLIALNPLVMADNFLWTLCSAGLLFTLAMVFVYQKVRFR
jgi:hypothetical protein